MRVSKNADPDIANQLVWVHPETYRKIRSQNGRELVILESDLRKAAPPEETRYTWSRSALSRCPRA